MTDIEKNDDSFNLLGIMGLARRRKKGPDKKYASFNRRMIAATLDFMLLAFLIAPVVDHFFNRFYGPSPINWPALQEEMRHQPTPQDADLLFMHTVLKTGFLVRWSANVALQGVVFALFSGICWHFWAATPGKMLVRIKVVDVKTDQPISDSQILLRIAGYFVSFTALFLGFFWIGLDRRRQGWHDKLAGTAVIVKPWRFKLSSLTAGRSGSREPSATE